MKKINILISVALSMILLSSCARNTLEYSEQNFFPEEMGPNAPLPMTFENNIPKEMQEEVFNKDIKIYTAEEAENTPERIAFLLETFDMQGAGKCIDSKSFFSYKLGNKYIDFSKKTGWFSFSGTNDEPLGSFPDMEGQKDEIDRAIINFAKEKNLLPKDYAVQGHVEQTSDGETVKYGPIIAQVIDGYNVWGYGSITSSCNSGGGNLSFSSRLFDYNYVETKKTANMEDAIAAIHADSSHVMYEHGMEDTVIDRATLDDVKIIYYVNGKSGYFVPCFSFKGVAYAGEKSDTFYVYVIAVPGAWKYIVSPEE